MATTAARKKWEEANRERLRAYHRAWSAANRERVKEYGLALKAKNPEHVKALARERMRAWRKANPERAKAAARKDVHLYNQRYPEKRPSRVRAWHAKNPEAKAVIEQRREARKRNAPGSGITRQQWATMQAESGGRCAYCAKVAKLTMDHVHPLSRGGAHDVTNIVPVCGNCNSQKHNNTLLLWLAKRAAA